MHQRQNAGIGRLAATRRELIVALGSMMTVWPHPTFAQQPERVYRIAGVGPSGSAGFLDPKKNPKYWGPFFDELSKQGFREGQNLAVERYFGNGRTDRFDELARRVVVAKPDVIYCASDRMARHMKAATATIPIVAAASDPIAFGLISSLAHPGGNITGVAPDAGLRLYAKHLQLLTEIAPLASRIAYLTPRAVWESPILLAPVKEAAERMGVSLLPATLDSPIDDEAYRRAFHTIEQSRPEALIVGDSPENNQHTLLIVKLAADGRLPTIYPGRWFPDAGGLMSYGANWPDLFRHAGVQIAQILKGTNPGDIPFYQSTRFELVINLKTAKALGLTVPQSFLARADEVIE